MTKKTKAKAKKAIMTPIIEEAKKLPPRPGLTYTANMDNIIISANYLEGSDKDEAGKYVAPYLRAVDEYKVLSVGPVVPSDSKIKIGSRVIPFNQGKINIIEMDEEGLVGTIKPHDIIAVVK